MSDQWTIDRGLVERIAKVARLELTEDEIEKFTKQLKVILEAFRELDDVDTEGVEPSFHPSAPPTCLLPRTCEWPVCRPVIRVHRDGAQTGLPE